MQFAFKMYSFGCLSQIFGCLSQLAFCLSHICSFPNIGSVVCDAELSVFHGGIGEEGSRNNLLPTRLVGRTISIRFVRLLVWCFLRLAFDKLLFEKTGLIPNALTIVYDGGKKWFISGLHNRNETFFLVHHLFSFPASFTSRPKKQQIKKRTPEEIAAAEEFEKRLLLSGGTAATAAITNSTTASLSSSSTAALSNNDNSLAAKKELVEVDVKTSAEARALVLQIRELAKDTLNVSVRFETVFHS
jgi:hypothetical protein